MSLVVGISGKIGAGKDEVAKRMVSHWGFTIVRFSEDLKVEVLRIFSRTVRAATADFWGKQVDAVTQAEMRDLVYNRKPPVIRALLQEHGTELRRAEEPAYWVTRWRARIDSLLRDGVSRIVAQDVRFENEARAIRAMNGLLVKVERPGLATPALAADDPTLHVVARQVD